MAFRYEYPHMAVSVDLVLFDNTRQTPSVLLIKRGKDPFRGNWALPGGYVDMGERIEDAARRELLEETGAHAEKVHFLGFFDAIDRDPRERTISFAFWSTTSRKRQEVAAADDASDADWHLVSDLPMLAFDHEEIVAKAVSELAASEP